MGDFESWQVKHPVVATTKRMDMFKHLDFEIFIDKEKFDEWAENEEDPAVFVNSQNKIQSIAMFTSNIGWKADFKKGMKQVNIPIKRLHIDF